MPTQSTLPSITTYITSHDPSTGQAIIHSTRPATWTSYDAERMAFETLYTTSTFPVNLNDNNADIRTHDALIASGTLGLVNPAGTVCRIVDFSPGYTAPMHRTQSLDYGVVLEGAVEMLLDSDSDSGENGGERRTLLKRGDVAVQRATNHAWYNPSSTEWARMLFVLQPTLPVVVGGEALLEGSERGVEGLKTS